MLVHVELGLQLRRHGVFRHGMAVHETTLYGRGKA